jgi:hypothetical protein
MNTLTFPNLLIQCKVWALNLPSIINENQDKLGISNGKKNVEYLLYSNKRKVVPVRP